MEVIKFYADWCGPCRATKETFKNVSNKFKDVKFTEVDIDLDPNMASKFNVRSIPTVLIINKGIECDRIVGMFQEYDLEIKIKNCL